LREAENEECVVAVVLVGAVRGGGKEDRIADHGGHGKTLDRESVLKLNIQFQ